MWKRRPITIATAVSGSGTSATVHPRRMAAITACCKLRTMSTASRNNTPIIFQPLVSRCHRPSITSVISPTLVATHHHHHHNHHHHHHHLACSARLDHIPTTTAVGMLLRRYASTIAHDVASEEECETTSTTLTPPPPTTSSSLGDNGYLGNILNAKVYDVAVETELQHAENLSQVSIY
jgi:hypothetical protein